jgi:chromosome segregation ATPase
VEGKAKGNVDYMEMQNTCKALKERNANLQRENEDSATTISKMSSDLTVLREAAKRTKAESEVMGRDAQDELKTYKEKALKALQQSNERVAELTRENASLKEFNEGYKRDAEDARDEKDKVEMTADTLRSEISTLTTSQSGEN